MNRPRVFFMFVGWLHLSFPKVIYAYDALKILYYWSSTLDIFMRFDFRLFSPCT